MNSFDISDDICNIVKLCHSYGVNTVYVSTITVKPAFLKLVNDNNNLLIAKEVL